MSVPVRVEQGPKATTEVAVYCGACRGWIGTVPAGTAWFRGRCISRRCPRYAEAQRIKTQ